MEYRRITENPFDRERNFLMWEMFATTLKQQICLLYIFPSHIKTMEWGNCCHFTIMFRINRNILILVGAFPIYLNFYSRIEFHISHRNLELCNSLEHSMFALTMITMCCLCDKNTFSRRYVIASPLKVWNWKTRTFGWHFDFSMQHSDRWSRQDKY